MTWGRPLTLSSWPRAIVHIDGDAFFASCEQALHPEYRGRPVITGKERNIVAAASYEAKARGVSRGVPLWKVRELCPDAIIVPSDYETYSLFSKRMFAVMRRFTSIVEEYSIDEGFADITGLRRPMRASYEEIVRQMKTAIESELGLTVSVGLSLSKVLAKLGSKWRKPSGLTVISGRHIHEILAKTPAEKVWGIGPATAAYCRNLGIITALDLARQSGSFVAAKFAKPQQEIWQELNGHSVYPVETAEKSGYASISKTRTFTPPSADQQFVFAQLLKNLENACIKARRHGLAAGEMFIHLCAQDFRTVGLEARLSRPTAFPIDMTGMLRRMFDQVFRPRTLYRATGVVLADLSPVGHEQLDLFEPAVRIQKMTRLYQAVDDLAAKLGKHCVFAAGALAAHKRPQHADDRGDVPLRKLRRLPGETERKHLGIPLLMDGTI
jgi:DNA polymerase-4/DNA polymerase V